MIVVVTVTAYGLRHLYIMVADARLCVAFFSSERYHFRCILYWIFVFLSLKFIAILQSNKYYFY